MLRHECFSQFLWLGGFYRCFLNTVKPNICGASDEFIYNVKIALFQFALKQPPLCLVSSDTGTWWQFVSFTDFLLRERRRWNAGIHHCDKVRRVHDSPLLLIADSLCHGFPPQSCCRGFSILPLSCNNICILRKRVFPSCLFKVIVFYHL